MTIQRDDPERRPGSASILRMSVPELAQWSSVVHAFTGDCGPWETSIQRKMAFWNELAGPLALKSHMWPSSPGAWGRRSGSAFRGR